MVRTLAQPDVLVATGRVTCPQCRSRLEIFETPSGGRTVSVAGLGTTVEPQALERFMAPDEGPDIVCPACKLQIDPAAPYRGELRRFQG
jgi:DNA-directed RNA polymerase subunit RPC12/RpoP